MLLELVKARGSPHRTTDRLAVTVALGLDREVPEDGRDQDLLLIAYGRRPPSGGPRGDEVHRFVTA
ncbi:hypothetical protein AB0L75_41745 [Streptomyces sp. NPDC052101]|uniref:hypothetical protein n=1 Tax=Streptomyces sp. NPDC052101 TaxID=3155763 RepID=UPI00342C98F6